MFLSLIRRGYHYRLPRQSVRLSVYLQSLLSLLLLFLSFFASQTPLCPLAFVSELDSPIALSLSLCLLVSSSLLAGVCFPRLRSLGLSLSLLFFWFTWPHLRSFIIHPFCSYLPSLHFTTPISSCGAHVVLLCFTTSHLSNYPITSLFFPALAMVFFVHRSRRPIENHKKSIFHYLFVSTLSVCISSAFLLLYFLLLRLPRFSVPFFVTFIARVICIQLFVSPCPLSLCSLP